MTVKINSTTHQIGSFFYNQETHQISGPADYMADRFSDRMAKIHAGQDAVFNFGSQRGITTHGGAKFDVVSLVMVSLQTDYAAYQGMKNFANREVTS